MDKKNWAIVFEDVMKLNLVEVPVPEIGPTDVLINVKATAICSQEQRMYKGIRKVCGFPCIGGHESAGVVVAVGEHVRGIEVGDYATLGAAEYHFPDGYPNGRTDGFYEEEYGSLTRYVKMRDTEVLVVKDRSVPFEKLCLNEPVACVANSIARADVHFGDYCLVIGAGIMGLLHVQLLKKQGAIVMVSEACFPVFRSSQTRVSPAVSASGSAARSAPNMAAGTSGSRSSRFSAAAISERQRSIFSLSSG